MTALDALLDAPKPEPRRDRWGRPLIVFPGEPKPRALTRVTTLAETLSDRFALEAWACRMTALGIAQRRDLYAQVASLTADDKGKLNEIVEQAKEAAGATAAANTGTALHRITERVDAGEVVEVPEPWDADIGAYTATLAAHGIEVLPDLIECFVVNQALEVAGTADRFVRWAGRDRLVVADLKGLALTTPLPTPSGWTTMGAVEVGDEVFGSDGRPCRVTAKSEIKQIGTYIVRFDDGSEVVCDTEHIWWTDSSWHGGEQPTAKPVGEVIDTLLDGRGSARHRVPVAGALDLPDVELPIDPYLLGCWLGDGAVRGGTITKGRDLFEILEGDGHPLGVEQVDKRSGCVTRTVLGLQTLLRAEGLTHNKHIPDAYLRASSAQRLRLLQGLMDTDGTWNTARRTAVFSSTDKRLAVQVRELALSLGQRAHLAEIQTHGFGKDVTSYAVEFTPACINPFRLPRKADQAAASTKPTTWARRRMIRSIEPGPDVPTACIAVDSPNRTYLCGEAMIPTHNTGSHLNFGAIAIQLACYATAETRYDPGTDTHEPMPDVDPGVGLVIHLPAGQARCDIYALDLTEGRRWAKVAAEVREWRKAPKLRPLTPPAFADVAPTGDPERAAWLRRRVEWLRDNHPDVLASLAAAWPVGVPTFKADHAHTAAELDLIDAQLKVAEATHGVPFSDEPAPPSRDALAAALRALPPDLLAEIEAEAAAEGVPSLASPTIAPGHLEWIDNWLESKAGAALASRGHRLRGAYRDACDEDPEMVPALVATVTAHRGGAADPYRLTEREVDHACALATAVTAGHVQFIATETGWRLEVPDPDAALALLCAERSKTEVRDEAKRLATQLGTKAPRSAADVAADPLLFACVHAGI